MSDAMVAPVTTAAVPATLSARDVSRCVAQPESSHAPAKPSTMRDPR
ncbi:MAG TPA: hypothetical protein VFS43_25440 [Polyangiaceae bacterium]|nr:hypothetical protein [Polyangiaceae bacterium]